MQNAWCIDQAAIHLAHYFTARGSSTGDVARLSLRADVPVPGSSGTVRLERTAIATLTLRQRPGEVLPRGDVITVVKSALA